MPRVIPQKREVSVNQTIAEFCVKVYSFLLPIAWIAVAIVVVILLPMALFRATRSVAGIGIFASSYLFGITTWFLGATITFATWGWIGLLIGLLFAGIGVVPIGVLAAFIALKEPVLGFSLIAMIFIVFGARAGGMAIAELNGEKHNKNINSDAS